MHSLLNKMLQVSQATPIDKINEELLNTWTECIKIAAKEGDLTAIKIWRKNYARSNSKNTTIR